MKFNNKITSTSAPISQTSRMKVVNKHPLNIYNIFTRVNVKFELG